MKVVEYASIATQVSSASSANTDMSAGQRQTPNNKGQSLFASHLPELVAAFALLLMAINFFAVISRKSLTNDEKYHIPAGYYHLVFGNFQLNPEHPPLAKMLSAIPLVFIHPAAPVATPGPTDNPILQGHDAFEAFWEANPNKLEAIAFWARVPMVLLTLVFGVVLFYYTRYVAGRRAAALAVVLFSLEPTILAHGRIVQTDVPAAFGYMLCFFALQRLIDAQTWRRILEFGLATGVALVTKFSLLIVLPIFLISLVIIGWRIHRKGTPFSRIALKIGTATLALLAVVNVVYYFKRTPLLPENREAMARRWPDHVVAEERTFGVVSQIVPSTYLFGVFVIKIHNEWGHYASILGNYSRTGWWYYFPVAFAFKTSLPFLLISLISIFWALLTVIKRKEKRVLLLLLAIAIYTVFSMTGRINIGVRHFLPVYPFLFMLTGMFFDELLLRRRKVAIVGALIVVTWMAVEVARTFPNYVPYMNQLASAHPHWYYLSDSNIEWGDDTGELARYLRDRGETKVRAAVSGGWLSKPEYGVDYVNPLVVDQPVEPTRYIAIGASFLNGSTVPLIRYKDGRPITEQQRRDFFAAYRQRQPEAIFGGSIYLFREGD